MIGSDFLSYSFVLILLLACHKTFANTESESLDPKNDLKKSQDINQEASVQSNLNQKIKSSKKTTTIRDQALKQLLDKAFPLTPEQIKKIRKVQDESQEAVATHPKTPPQPLSSTQKVDLSPGNMAPVIRLSAGFITSLVFVDATGQPWPVADYSLGDPNSFNIQWDKKTNTLFIQSMKSYASANMAVRLANLETPIMISIITGQKVVDYRVDLQIPGQGPNALPLSEQDSIEGRTSKNLLSVLDGLPPSDSIELTLLGGNGRAWLTKKGTLILRTKLSVLSPAWSTTISSLDGTHVYEMMQTPLILATENGKTIKMQVKGY